MKFFFTNFNQSLIMIEFDPNNLPLETKISFHKLFEYYRKMLSSVNGTASFKAKAKKILSLSEQYPELSEGFSDVSLLEKYGTVIPEILQDIFPEVMSKSEMKVLTLLVGKFIMRQLFLKIQSKQQGLNMNYNFGSTQWDMTIYYRVRLFYRIITDTR